MCETTIATAKTAVITGGSRGIGRAICVKLAEQGMNVVINYSGNEGAAIEAQKLCGGEVFQADVSKIDEAKKLVEFAVEKFGGLDVVVNNAGITKDNLILRMTEEDFDSVMDVNLKGAWNMTKHGSRAMGKQGSGRIINITSVVGQMGNAGQSNYCASKAGIIGLTKSAARELAGRGITVNAVAPGFIETDMTDVLKEDVKQKMLENIPLKLFGEPSDIANTVAFLASIEAKYITGQVISVNGGMYM